MSRFATQLGRGLARLDTVAAETVTYTRPSTAESISLSAVPGVSEFEGVDDNGMTTTMRAKDWLFDAADLKLDGSTVVEPAVGDEIRKDDPQGETDVFRVLPFGGDKELWRYSDANESRLRVHTKRVATE